MTKSTTATNTTAYPVSDRKIQWNTDAIFDSAFMFPTVHFENVDVMNKMDEMEFSNIVVSMLETVGKLSPNETAEMVSSVKSKNRLRVYFHATTLVNAHIAAASVTEPDTSLLHEMSDKDIKIACDQNGMRIDEISSSNQVSDHLENQ